MKRAGLAVALVGALAVAGGCATLTKGKRQTIAVTSNVEGAEVLVDGVRVGMTPFTGLAPRGKEVLMVQKAGYQTANVVLSKSIEPMFWGNILIGGTLGSLTDYSTGAMYEYKPATYQVELKSATQSLEDFRQQVALRGFAMLYIDEISRDLGRGSGSHIAALLTLVNGDRPGAVDASHIRQALTDSRGDPVGFGHRIIALK